MCGIVMTNDPTQLLNLYEANATRGKHSYSFCAINIKNEVIMLHNSLGIVDPLTLSKMIAEVKDRASIYIMHNQAPTTDAQDVSSIHPYRDVEAESLVWHNGILKPHFVKMMRPDVKWDTIVLSDVLNGKTDKTLSDVDGSFAFVHLIEGQKLTMGRNTICPLYQFYQKDKFYISSVPLSNEYKEIPSGEIIEILCDGLMISFSNDNFTTFQMPYYLGDDD